MSKEIKNYGRSVKNTFENRGTGYVEGHPLFGEEFFKDPIRTSRWNGFLKSIRRNEEIAFEEVGNVTMTHHSTRLYVRL